MLPDKLPQIPTVSVLLHSDTFFSRDHLVTLFLQSHKAYLAKVGEHPRFLGQAMIVSSLF
jgi:hypothetical protein